MAEAKIAFLYSEVAGYFLAGVKELAQRNSVMVIRWPVNNDEAPFQLEDSDNFKQLDKSQFSLSDLQEQLDAFGPDILICSGWMDKEYLKLAKSFKKRIPVVLTLDNHWNGSLKQRALSLLSNLYLKKRFTHAWVPGDIQKKYAEKLGFKGKVVKNFYCADVELFAQMFALTFPPKESNPPKRFLYVARYVEHKGIFEMWNAFVELQKEHPNCGV